MIRTKTDEELQHDVMVELEWESSVDTAEIQVAVNDGVVTLSGSVNIGNEKFAAERIVSQVFGVRAVASEIKVRLPSSFERTDADIAKAASNALEWHVWVPHDRVKLQVHDGWITLSGAVDWAYQKDAAYEAVHNLKGVWGVSSDIMAGLP